MHQSNFNGPDGRLRKLPSRERRALPTRDRLAYNFRFYLVRVVNRLNLPEVAIEAGLHQGRVVKFSFTVHWRDDRGRGPQKQRPVSIPGNADEVLKNRVALLTRHFIVRFGGLDILIANGDLIRLRIDDSIRPQSEDYRRLFGE